MRSSLRRPDPTSANGGRTTEEQLTCAWNIGRPLRGRPMLFGLVKWRSKVIYRPDHRRDDTKHLRPHERHPGWAPGRTHASEDSSRGTLTSSHFLAHSESLVLASRWDANGSSSANRWSFPPPPRNDRPATLYQPCRVGCRRPLPLLAVVATAVLVNGISGSHERGRQPGRDHRQTGAADRQPRGACRFPGQGMWRGPGTPPARRSPAPGAGTRHPA